MDLLVFDVSPVEKGRFHPKWNSEIVDQGVEAQPVISQGQWPES